MHIHFEPNQTQKTTSVRVRVFLIFVNFSQPALSTSTLVQVEVVKEKSFAVAMAVDR